MKDKGRMMNDGSLLSKKFPRRGKIRIAVGETHGRRPSLFGPTLKGSNTQIRMVQPLAGLGRFFQPVPWVSPTAIHIGLLSESQKSGLCCELW